MMKSRKRLLQDARRAKHLTQQQVADLLGITLRSYQRYEYGERNISLEVAVRLSEILDISIYDLVGRNSTPNGESA